MQEAEATIEAEAMIGAVVGAMIEAKVKVKIEAEARAVAGAKALNGEANIEDLDLDLRPGLRLDAILSGIWSYCQILPRNQGTSRIEEGII